MARRPLTSDDILSILHPFDFAYLPTSAEPYGSGHINDTFAINCDGSGERFSYIAQRLNTTVFPRPDWVMDNIVRVTDHLRLKIEADGGDPDRESLVVIQTETGEPYLTDDAGDPWRVYRFVQKARTHDVLENEAQAFEAAKAFGRFQKRLADLPGEPLHETIANFHHTPARFQALKGAIAADAAGRLEACRAEVDFALAQEAMVTVVTDGLESGELPWRVTHNDTKINNVMLDNESGNAVCVIDLDTVMPGSALYDFGDMVRTSTGHFAENETDLSKVYLDLDRFGALVRGYLESAGDFLTDREIELLPTSGILITFEIGIRFLTDYLQGDVYFKTHHEHENLDRARTQFAFVRDMQAHVADMTAVVEQTTIC